MPIYKGSGQITRQWLGVKEITRVWKGTDLIYQKGSPPGPAENTLFDNGWVSGVPWSGNLLPRPQYTSIATYNFSLVDSNGEMQLLVNISDSYSHVTHNSHVCTSELITVPSGATKMYLNCAVPAYNTGHIKWGLVDAGAANSQDDTSGQLSAWVSINSTPERAVTLEQTLSAGMAGAQKRFIINWRAYADGYSDGSYAANSALYIYKVWFE